MKGWIVQELPPNGQVPPDGIQITTDDMLLAIGQLYIQVQTLQRMLRSLSKGDASQERSLQSQDN